MDLHQISHGELTGRRLRAAAAGARYLVQRARVERPSVPGGGEGVIRPGWGEVGCYRRGKGGRKAGSWVISDTDEYSEELWRDAVVYIL